MKLNTYKSFTYCLAIFFVIAQEAVYAQCGGIPAWAGVCIGDGPGTQRTHGGNLWEVNNWWECNEPGTGGSWIDRGPCLTAPTLTTSGGDNEGCTSMDLVGNISSEGSAAVTEKGFFYSTNSADVDAATYAAPGSATKVSTAAGGTGDFSESLTGLASSTTYYFKAFAYNGAASYGARTSATTLAPCTAPTVSTTSATPQCTAADLVGNVTDHGNETVTKGFIYGTNSAAVTAATTGALGGMSLSTHGTVAVATGAYTNSITGLVASTTYYFKAYASNTTGDAYGAVSNFTTNAGCTPPVVAATVAATEVVCTTANPGGNVTSDGGSTITERGLCYGTASNPTTADSKSVQAGTTGSWTGSLTGLAEGTTYYVRAYATNSEGTTYGTETSFTTLTCPAVTYYTIADGAWGTAANWNCTCVPSLSFTGNSFRVYHDMTYTGTLSGLDGVAQSYIMPGGSITTTAGLTINTNGGGDIIMYSGSSLTIGTTLALSGVAGSDILSAGNITATTATLSGAADIQTTAGTYNFGAVNLTSEGQINLVNSTLNVTNDIDIGASAGLTASGTPVTVGGNYSNNGNVATTFDANVSITGNVVNTGNSTITFGGTSTVGGNLTGTGNGDYAVTGTLNVTGVITLNTDADLSGTGVVAFGSSAIDGSGNSHFICNGGGKRDNWAGNDPASPVPDNPINLTTCGPGVLPVEIIAFSAQGFDTRIELKWLTGSEINNSHFEILASEDGVNWKVVGSVGGAGNSDRVIEYNYVVYDTQYNYFKLKQVDFDGRYNFTGIVKVATNQNGGIVLFPNPATNVLNIEALISHDGVYTIQIVGADGRISHEQEGFLLEGKNNAQFNVSSLSNGVYELVIVSGSGERMHRRFVKQ